MATSESTITKIIRDEERFSDRTYVTWANTIPRPLEENFRFVREFLQTKANMLILDAGCGPGLVTRELVKFGNVLGIDISNSTLTLARHNEPKGVFVRASIHSLPLKDQVIDLVLFWDALHHVPNLEQTIAESFRVLRNGGCLFAFEPNMHSYQFVLFKYVYTSMMKSEYERPLSVFQLKAILLKSGFSGVVSRTIGIIPHRLYVKLGGKFSTIFCRLNWALAEMPLLSMLGGRICIYAAKASTRSPGHP